MTTRASYTMSFSQESPSSSSIVSAWVSVIDENSPNGCEVAVADGENGVSALEEGESGMVYCLLEGDRRHRRR